jgi:hypothetical protein
MEALMASHIVQGMRLIRTWPSAYAARAILAAWFRSANYFCGGLTAIGLPVVVGLSCSEFSVAMSLICLVIATDWNVSALESCFKSS